MTPIMYMYSHPRCAILDGKLYHFEFPDCKAPLDPGPLEIIWFPPNLAGGSASLGFLADPCNNRILMNLSGRNLYAYYPRESEFELVGKGVYPWSNVVALADNVLYVYCDQSLYAYDVSNMAKHLDVVWTSGVGFKFTFEEYSALFHVGNNNFWFAIGSPDIDYEYVIYFIKFEARRAGNKITCTPLALQKYQLESTCSVLDFHFLEEEAACN